MVLVLAQVAAQSRGEEAAVGIFVSVMLGALLGLYFLPTIVALARRAPNVGPIVVINVFLGWSLVGWVVALAMAVSAHATPPVVNVGYPPVDTTDAAPPAAAPAPTWPSAPEVPE